MGTGTKQEMTRTVVSKLSKEDLQDEVFSSEAHENGKKADGAAKSKSSESGGWLLRKWEIIIIIMTVAP